jgi:hypothetical protein
MNIPKDKNRQKTGDHRTVAVQDDVHPRAEGED